MAFDPHGGTDRVYQYSGAVSRTSGSAAADAYFALAPGNTNPQGIADPPVAGSAAPITSVATTPSSDGVWLAAIDGPALRLSGSAKPERSSSVTARSEPAAALWIDAALALVADRPGIALSPAGSGLSPRQSPNRAGDIEWQTDVDDLMADDDGLALNQPGTRGRRRG